MKKIRVHDVKWAIIKVVHNQQTKDLLDNLNDNELFKSSIEDLHMVPGQVSCVIEQLSKDSHICLPRELHKVLPNNTIKSIVETVNFCIKEEEQLGISENQIF